MNLKSIIDCKRGNSFYIYADTAFIHQGESDYLEKLIDEVYRANCDGIKFQLLFDVASSYSDKLPNYSVINNWIFSPNKWLSFIQYAKKLGLDVIILPIDISALDFCFANTELIDAIELHSISLNEIQMLERITELDKIPIILGIGGRTIDEIELALDYTERNNIILMHGIQNFPTEVSDTCLSKIAKLSAFYPHLIGYADHTLYNNVYGEYLLEYAYLLGARVFEKHLTLEKGVKRIDYEAAVNIDDLINIRSRLEILINILGDDSRYHVTNKEVKYRKREKKLAYAKSCIKGERIDQESLMYIVHPEDSELEQSDYKKIIGRKLKKNVVEKELVKLADLSD